MNAFIKIFALALLNSIACSLVILLINDIYFFGLILVTFLFNFLINLSFAVTSSLHSRLFYRNFLLSTIGSSFIVSIYFLLIINFKIIGLLFGMFLSLLLYNIMLYLLYKIQKSKLLWSSLSLIMAILVFTLINLTSQGGLDPSHLLFFVVFVNGVVIPYFAQKKDFPQKEDAH